MSSNNAPVESFANPALYSAAEIERACAIAAAFGRGGKLILTLPPAAREPR